MNIAILGTRGIPNRYGGFEQCAEKLSLNFRRAGHSVFVYVPNDHSYKELVWNDIKLERIFSNEKIFKSFNSLIYDFLSLKHAVKKEHDIILELGYNPAGYFLNLIADTNKKIVTNMDGLEWKRGKWNKYIQKFSKLCERKAVQYSTALIADNIGIQEYIKREYGRDSIYLPYGAEIFDNPEKKVLDYYNIKMNEYFMLMARLEPENNTEMILDGYAASNSNKPFLVIGSHHTKYGKYLLDKFRNKNVRFLGGIYDYNIVSTLRYYSCTYFHGHSVGGTNPSLLEAMASNARIAAHDNIFNKSILKECALYFKNSNDVKLYIKGNRDLFNIKWIEKNKELILTEYNWERISQGYLTLFKELIEGRREDEKIIANRNIVKDEKPLTIKIKEE